MGEDSSCNNLTETLKVHSYDWQIKDKYDNDGNVTILSWCLNEDSKPYLLRFHNFPTFCYVELPIFLSNRGKTSPTKWTKFKANLVYDAICYKLQDYQPTGFQLQFKEKLYFFRGYKKKFPMLLLRFNTLEAMFECKKKLKYPLNVKGIKGDNIRTSVAVKVWETDIPLERKLLTIKDVKYSQWFNVQGLRVKDKDKISHLEYEYVVDWQTMVGIDCNTITHPKIFSFDIETYTDKHNALPDPLASKHVCYMISVVVQRIMEPETRKTYMILFGKSHDTELADLIIVNSELELIDKLQDLVIEHDPEIITGYNILGYDNPYLDTRLKRTMGEWRPISRLLDEKVEMKAMSWSSSAYKDQEFNWWGTGGRITVDLLPVIKRDFKLPLYKLDFVANHFLNTGKHEVTPQQMFETYELQACLEDNYDADVEKIPKSFIESKENPEEGIVFTEEELRPIWNEECKEFALSEMKKVVDYCVVDSDLVLDIFEKIHVWIALIEMSNVVAVAPSSLFTRGTQIRSLSQIYDEASRKGIVIDHQMFEKIHIEGGFVYDPIPGIYHNIPCLDFKSLYPTVMIANNIDHRSFVPPELEDKIPDSMCHIIEWDEEVEVEDSSEEDSEEEDSDEDDIVIVKKKKKKVKKFVTNHYKYKFVKDADTIIPTLLMRLWKQRDAAKAELKEAVDPIRRAVLHQKQLQIKLNMNSVSGDTPVPCLVNNFFEYRTIEELTDGNWLNDQAGNQVSQSDKNVKVWSDKGWTDIKFVIRHPVKTPLVRVNTHTGCVDCTEEHSLLKPNGVQVKPTEVEIGDTLMHSWPSFEKNNMNIFDTMIMGNYHKGRIPKEILNAKQLYKKSFLNHLGFYKTSSITLTTKIEAAEFCFLLKEVGHHPKVDYSNNTYKITINGTDKNQIISLNPSPEHYNNEYIYDIETESHHFAAGVGNMIVHNSMYGLFAAQNCGKLPLPQAAAAITAESRKSTKMMNSYIRSKGHSIVYGDSVTGETPILIKSTSENYVEIQKLWRGPWKKENGKEYAKLRDLKVWSDQGFTDIKYIMRHKTNKRLYRITTDTGIVTVTEDHSLLDEHANVIKPNNVNIRDKLLIKKLDNDKQTELIPEGIFCYCSTQIKAAQHFKYLSKKHSNVSLKTRLDKYGKTEYLICGQTNIESGIIKKIEDLGYVNDYVYDLETENHHFAAGIGELVVHNTDSTMPDLKLYGMEPQAAWKICERWADELTALFPKPMEVEMENLYDTMLCIKKKNYLCIKIDKKTWKPYPLPKQMKITGAPPARRDKTKYQIDMYMSVSWKVMKRKQMLSVFNYIVDSTLELYTRQIKLKDLIIIESVGATYKNENYRMKIFKDEMAKIGHPLVPGERIQYVICKTFGIDETQKLGYKMRTPEVYKNKLCTETPDKLDYTYYLEKKIMNSIEKQLFQIGYKDELKELEEKFLEVDRGRVLRDLRKQGYDHIVDELMRKYDNDKEDVIEHLMDPVKIGKLLKIVKPLYRFHIKRRQGRKKRVCARVSAEPIGMMLRLIDLKTKALDEIKFRNGKPMKLKKKVIKKKIKKKSIKLNIIKKIQKEKVVENWRDKRINQLSQNRTQTIS